MNNTGFVAGTLIHTDKGLVSIQYQDAGRSLEGLVAVKKKNKWGSVNHKGELITPYKYDNFFMFYAGVATVSLDNDYFYIDYTGKRLI